LKVSFIIGNADIILPPISALYVTHENIHQDIDKAAKIEINGNEKKNNMKNNITSPMAQP
jgi:hypothetical protein